jgi:type 1 glutamine amidotransferase
MEPIKLLVFVGTEGVHHDHAGQGRYMADALSGMEGIEADFSQDYEVLADGLAAYDAVLFYTDVGALTDAQEEGLLDFIRRGGGFFGLHTAAASFRDRAGYHAMLNGFFGGHSKYMDFEVTIIDPEHPITRGLSVFTVKDELYYLRHDPAKSHHLMQAYDPTRDESYVMAFTHTYGQGRVFYFALGHDMAVLEHPSFLEVLRRGSLWIGQRL